MLFCKEMGCPYLSLPMSCPNLKAYSNVEVGMKAYSNGGIEVGMKAYGNVEVGMNAYSNGDIEVGMKAYSNGGIEVGMKA